MIVFLLMSVTVSIAVMAGLGYLQISAVTVDNANIRIDRAARGVGAIVALSFADRFQVIRSDDGRPSAIQLTPDAAPDILRSAPEFDRLVRQIAFVNQGESQFFRFNASTRMFDRLATTLRLPDGSTPPAQALGPAHPAYAALAQGKVYLGRVPVLGRLRYANLIPILTASGDVAGALTFDVGWVDDLTAARDELARTILFWSGTILLVVACLGIILMIREMRPLLVIAQFANALASGTKAGEAPFTGRRDEIGAVAQGLSRVVGLQRDLEYLAYTDPLTDLRNRSGYLVDLDQALRRCTVEGKRYAMLHMDIDRFKDINEAFGHTAGDELLKSMSAVFRAELAEAFSLARIGGDDFTAILELNDDGQHLAGLCERIADAVAKPVELQHGNIQASTCIGVVLLPHDARNVEEAHRKADLALREAKFKGRIRYAFYARALDDAAQNQVRLERMLRQALDNQELTLYFQPQFKTRDLSLHGVEALARWPHAERGLILPAEFIPVAESTGLIVQLGAWVIDESCRLAREWLDTGFDFRHVSVNVSPKQLWQPHFIETVRGALDRHQLAGGYLCLEITESVFVDHNEERIIKIMQGLRELGVSMALDDFGSGYSSLGYLNKLPFDQLKVDRAFISNVDGDARKESILRGIVALGKGLGLEIIAEGAEREQEATLVREIGCDAVQGYFYARPIAAQLLPAEVERIRSEQSSAVPRQLDT